MDSSSLVVRVTLGLARDNTGYRRLYGAWSALKGQCGHADMPTAYLGFMARINPGESYLASEMLRSEGTADSSMG